MNPQRDSVMLNCDMRIAKHEVGRFGHPHGKIPHLNFVMLMRGLNIVQSDIAMD